MQVAKVYKACDFKAFKCFVYGIKNKFIYYTNQISIITYGFLIFSGGRERVHWLNIEDTYF